MEYCCDEFEDCIDRDDITHQYEMYTLNNTDDKWHLKFYAHDSGGENVYRFIKINYCPFCRTKL